MSGPSYDEVVARLRAAGCVWAEDEARLLLAEASSPGELSRLVGLREAGLPLERVLGWAELAGVRVAVDPGVFVPRRRSELLVREARAALASSLAAASAASARPVVVDLCCGTGAVGLAVVRGLGACDLHASDVDPAAVACARGNVEPLGGQVHEGDLYDALPPGLRADVLVVNAPYVPTSELDLLPREAREHEPAVALDGGDDGVALHRRVASGAPARLTTGGVLLVETSQVQTPLTLAAFGAAGLRARVVVDDDLGAVVVVGSPF